jgi:hypothetical protein
MSKILRRPMFRGGPVDSRGTGITSGLTDKPKRGLVDEPGGYAGVTTGGDLMNKNRFSYFDPNALPGFRNVKRAMPITDIFGSKDSAGMQLGNTDYLVEKGYLSNVEKPVSEMSMEELIDYQLGEKGDVFQTGKSGLEKDRPRQVESTADLTEDELREYRTTGMTSKNEALEGKSSRPVEVIETAEDGSIKLTNDATGNAEQKTEMSARDIVKENAELFKEFLNEGNEKKLKSARIGDVSDYLLKFFEGSQKEGATVGSSAADVAAFATAKDSKTERAKAAIEKTNDTATVLAINDYIAGKRSKEQIDAMLAKSDIGFAQAIALADYKKGKEDFFENLKENRKGMGSAEAIITTVQETFKKVPTVLTDKDIKQENFGLLNEENVGEYFVYPDGKVTKIDKIGNELTEVVIYTRGG